MKTILVTGSAGFIGSNLVLRLLKEGFGGEAVRVVGVDNMNDYYDPSLKEYRQKQLKDTSEELKVDYHFVRGSIADRELVGRVFREYQPDIVVNRRQAESDAKLAWA